MVIMSFFKIIKGAVSALAIVTAVCASPITHDVSTDLQPISERDVDVGLVRRAQPLFDFNNKKVRGVNLGGWFVLEPWITPSIFEPWKNNKQVIDEFTYTKKLGKREAAKRLDQHWKTWIKEADFKAIAKAGLNHVRIPVGYWAVLAINGDPYVQGQIPYLDKAIKWARAAKLKVMIDLHGAPGSQNGFDNSGRNGTIAWQSGDTLDQTRSAIEALTNRYAPASDVVTSIEILNEPLGAKLNLDKLRDFYNTGYSTVRKYSESTAVVIQDGFEDVQGYWNGFMNIQSGRQNVILDTHSYQVFTPDLIALSPQDHVKVACGMAPKLAGTDKWLVVGEWTGAQTDCAKWLNGLGRGARYDGTLGAGTHHVGDCTNKYSGKVKDLSQADKHNLRTFIEAQLDAYEAHTGWFFWTWKTEGAPEWDMQDLLINGIFPQPLTARKYPGQCK